MSVDDATVRKIARLARIEIHEDKVTKMANELNGILNWIEMLNEVDVNGVEPMASAVAIALPMRDDAVTDGNIQSSILKNAPKADSGFFVVPKSVE
ncbi:MAG: aspartyl-tRNA(Asn)/glutamyl-tRNA (Gln) amidotransferase subunit C [Hyphomonadaceae bacterium]|nr:MAG: aspartyl-tRNA(Asn)/glutamyl-tRNA (Gln) amidotransferase subunit C [Hyphomonadaceae bacterium]